MTKQKKSLESAELAGILGSAMDAILAIDESQRIILFNGAAEEMFGCSAVAALGSPISRFIAERDCEKHADHIRPLVETGVSTRQMGALGDIWGLRTDGEEFPIEASIGRVRTNGQTVFTLIVRDVSQRMETERLLRETVARSTAILETAVDGIIATDERGTIESFNPAAETMFGYSAEEVLERNVQILMPGPHRGEHDGHLRNFLETGRKRIRGIGREVAGLRKDGTSFPMYLAVSESFTGERRFFTCIVRDLSERAAAEAALGASEARHRALVDHAQVCIHELDLKGRFRSINRCGLEMLGRRDASDVVGQRFLDFVGEVDRNRVADLIERAVHGESVTYEFEGEGRDFFCTLSPLRDENGNVVSLIGVSEDLTDRREAEAQLHRSEERLWAAFNQRGELAGFLNLDGTIIDTNERSLAMIGATRSEITGRAFWDTPWWDHDAALQERLRAGVARAAEGEFVRFEARHPRTDGVMAIVDFSLTPIRDEDGAVELLFAESLELTDQRRAESELRESEERFRTLATNAPVAIFRTDRHGEYLYVNPRWCEFAGLSEEEALGQGWTRALHPDDRDRLAKEWLELTASGLDPLPLSDRRLRTPDGRVTWLAGSAVALRGESGDRVGYLGSLMDLTERRRAHAAEKLASIATLTAGIAHDIGAPMTAILGYAEMMEKSLTDEKNRRRARIIVEQAQRISQLVQALLNMARPGERRFISLDLATVLETSLEFYREELHNRGITIEASIDTVLPIAGDADRLQQVFLNLIINAADAMASGGTLHVSLSNPDVRHTEVRIRDTGTGIAPNVADQIFDRFYTTKERGRGTGLGLMVAKEIVDEHGGDISFESELGVGTEFSIRFPVVGS